MATHVPTGKLLLLVEDDNIARRGLSSLLLRAGYSMAQAANGQEALDLLREGLVPDLILLDMLMPVLDGWQVMHQLQAVPFLASVPIVILTGTIMTQEWALAHGCAGLLKKPIAPEALLQEVQRCLV